MKKQAGTTHFFYQNGKLVTVNQGAQSHAIFRTAEVPLAEQQTTDAGGMDLLATDDKGSVLAVQKEGDDEEHSFTAYGHDPNLNAANRLIGFNGEYIEPVSRYYLLGTGYHRSYSAALMRFVSSDHHSPFDAGGINSYAYCGGDPTNRMDPSGQAWFRSLLKGAGNLLHLRKRSADKTPSPIASPPGAPRVPPEYTEVTPANHKSIDKSADLKLKEAASKESEAKKFEIAANRQRLSNLGKNMKNEKVPSSAQQRERELYSMADKLKNEAVAIRNTPGVSPPPTYDN